MPSSVGSALLIFGAVLTALTAVGGVIAAGAGVLWELFLFVRAGLE